MKYEETDRYGSFAALGIGFLYEYNATLKALQISRAGSCLPLVFLEFDGLASKDPIEFVRFFDKTTQIKALRFSNNTTVNLAETLDVSKLPAILKRIQNVTIYALQLKNERFTEFQTSMMLDHDLKRMEIVRADGTGGTPFYLATLETQRRNVAASRSSTLHGLASYLSDRIIEDIIAKEFSYNADSWVHKLLNTASALSTLSYVLNDRFEPSRKMGGKAPSLLSRLSAINKNTVNTAT